MKRLLLIAILLLGCARAKPEFSRISTGMTEAEVVKLIGKPSSTAMQGATKYLEYESYDRNHTWGYNFNYQNFYVRLVDGKVESYGRRGDFGTTE